MIPLWRKTIRDSVSDITAGDTTGHDLFHHLRVYGWARYIIREEPLKVDDEKVYPIALLHDIGWSVYKNLDIQKADPKGEKHMEYSAQLAKPILKKVDFPEDKIESILKGIKLHDDTKYWGNNTQGIETEIKVVQDADCLEAMGSIGLARIIIYGSGHSKALFKPDGTYNDSTIQNIEWHIKTLEKRLHTKTAKNLAKRLQSQQRQYVQNFLGQHAFAMKCATD